jgi:hypothetical protein
MKMKELTNIGKVEVYNNQHLWNNRMIQKVYDALRNIWGTKKLWLTINRANLNFPIKPGFVVLFVKPRNEVQQNYFNVF